MLIPIIKHNNSSTLGYKFFVTKNTLYPNVFYVTATFGTTIVGYKVDAANTIQTPKIPGLNPKNYNNITIGTVNAIAQSKQSPDGSISKGYRIDKLTLYKPNPNFEPTLSQDWLKKYDHDDCVNDLLRVSVSHPAETSNSTDINLIR